MKVTHELREPWKTHISDYMKLLAEHKAAILPLRGLINERETAALQIKEHLAAILGTLVKEASLPESVSGYQLSDDGAYLIGEVKD